MELRTFAAALAAALVVMMAGCTSPVNETADDAAQTLPTGTPSESPPAQENTTDPGPEPSDDPPPDPDPEPRNGETHTVKIADALLCQEAPFEPATLSIIVGDSVKWHNADGCTHTATADDGSFDTKNLDSGETSDAFKFDKVGTFTYKCALHPTTMTAKVVVAKE